MRVSGSVFHVLKEEGLSNATELQRLPQYLRILPHVLQSGIFDHILKYDWILIKKNRVLIEKVCWKGYWQCFTWLLLKTSNYPKTFYDSILYLHQLVYCLLQNYQITGSGVTGLIFALHMYIWIFYLQWFYVIPSYEESEAMCIVNVHCNRSVFCGLNWRTISRHMVCFGCHGTYTF